MSTPAKIVKCYLCDMECRASAMFASHYKKHQNVVSKDLFIRNTYINSGILPKQCLGCGLDIGFEDTNYHRECYIKSSPGSGSLNGNFSNATIYTDCVNCGTNVKRFKSTSENFINTFCSCKCSKEFYAKNPTNKIKASIEKWKQAGHDLHKTQEGREKWGNGYAFFTAKKRSKFETEVFQVLLSIYPDAIQDHRVEQYVLDSYIPSINVVLEAQGSYWHSVNNVEKLDIKKNKKLIEKGYNVRYLHEDEWNNNKKDQQKQIEFLKRSIKTETNPHPPHIRDRPLSIKTDHNIIIVNGAAASGKSWVCKQLNPSQYSYVSYDDTRKKDLLDKIKACPSNIPVVVDLHNGVSTFAKRQKDEFASIKVVCIVEDEVTIRARMSGRGGTFTIHTSKRMRRVETLRKRSDCIFSGTAAEVLEFLNGGCKVSS